MENRKVKINNSISQNRFESGPNNNNNNNNDDDDDNDVATSSSRPASYYDNIGGSSSLLANGSKNENDHGGTLNSNGRSSRNYSLTNGTVTSAKTTVPTQTVLLNTTVPQNIAATVNLELATRHTPTRNSLRHSRMIVMTRTGKVFRKSMPKIMRYHRLAKALVSLQTILASALCFLAMWLLMWAPNLKTRDNPYWSAIPLLISGILGLVLLCCCRKEYPGMPNEYSVITTKVFSIVLTTISGAVCLIAAAFAIIHLVSLSLMICGPQNQSSNSTCFCKVTPDSYHYNQTVSPLIKSYHYMDLTCLEVDNVLTILLICSSVVNAIAGIIALWYVYLHWASRYYYTYSKVRTKETKPIILTNA